tara:strand:- start:141 stop:464 length:324 start_codon:yes stop_codon:yes gene_type:complete
MSESKNLKVIDLKSKIKNVQDQIKKLVKEKKTNVEIELFFIENDSKFYEEYPYLVKKLIKGGDMEYLDVMLDNLQKIQDGDQTLASTELKLGDELAQKFVYPNIKKD